MENTDQLERILEQKTEQDGPVIDDGLSPLMPFPTSYELTRQQEEELIQHAIKRLEELESETGRDRCNSGDWWDGENSDHYDVEGMQGVDKPERTWMGKRVIYDLLYANNVDFRARLMGGIFAESNLVVPIARRITRQMIARASNYFFVTDPWFAIYPTGKMDRDRADKADRYARWKTDQSKLKRTQEMGIERAFVLGEAVTKTSWVRREQTYRTKAVVLVDDAGADILGMDGDYIMEDDLWLPEQIEDPATGEVTRSELFILKRDGQTPQPEQMNWQEKKITRRITHYKGPEAKVVNHMDFLCPLDAPTIQEADCVVHLYDTPVMSLADQWRKNIAKDADVSEHLESMRKAIDLLRVVASHGGQGETAQSNGSADNSADVNSNSRRNERSEPIAEIAEFHLRYDADGDGILEDVMLIIDKKSKMPIFYDYEANVTPDGLRPFSCTRVNEVPNRWYGIGSMEMFESSQQIVDLLVNRWNFGNSRASRVDFWNPQNTLEGRANSNLEVNWGGTYTPAPGKSASDCLESVYLENNTGDILKEFSEFFMQLMMNESGVQNANDGQIVGLESSKLATGIRNIEKSGQELFSLYIGHLEPGIAEVLSKTVKLIFANLDEMEVYRYFEEGEEGGEGVGEMQEINPGDLGNMAIDTRILLTRYRGEQILESSIRAIDTVEKFFDPAKTPEYQSRVAPMFIDILKALQIQNAKDIIVPLEFPVMQGGGQLPNPAEAAEAMSNPQVSEPNL
jgi:hypothetical protein